MNCDFCNAYKEDVSIFILPCGFSVCLDHINSQDVIFKCFLCLDHLIDKQQCLEIRKNKLKLSKIEFLNKRKQMLHEFDKINKLKNNFEFLLNNHFTNIINEIDLKREILKKRFSEEVNEYSILLIRNLERIHLDSVTCLKKNLDGLDTKPIREKLANTEILKSLDQGLIKQMEDDIFSDPRLNNIYQILENFEKIEQIKFKQSEIQPEFKLSKLFGTVESDNIKILPTEKVSKSSNSEKFNEIGEFGLKTLEELSTGEIVSSLHSRPSNILKIDPNNKTKEIFGDNLNLSKIDFILKSEKDEIISIHNDFCVKILRNGNLSSCFRYAEKKILFIDIFKTNLITFDQDNHLSIREYSNGKIEKIFKINSLKKIFSMRAMTDNLVLFGHDNMITLLDLNLGLESQSLKTSGRVLMIEKINQNEFIIGCNDGIISKWNSKSQLLSKKCHDGSIQCIQVCHDGNVLSLGMKDKKIGLRMAENLELIFQISTYNLMFCRRLISGKLVCLDSNGKVYEKENI